MEPDLYKTDSLSWSNTLKLLYQFEKSLRTLNFLQFIVFGNRPVHKPMLIMLAAFRNEIRISNYVPI